LVPMASFGRSRDAWFGGFRGLHCESEISARFHLDGYTIVYLSGKLSLVPAKNSGFRIRVERELREAFTSACRSEGKVAAQACVSSCVRMWIPSRRAGRFV
jgi:hypothetical protein